MSAPTRRPRRSRSLALRRKGIITVPQEVRDELDLREGDNLLLTVEEGRIVLTPTALIPRDQAWFWTEDWQARETEADAQMANAEGVVYRSDSEFLASLDSDD
jgi:AbrB family looped-hinge helix DNA binding protein